MNPGEFDAIVGGYHGDPFSVLGPHRVEDGWVVRAFLPHAAQAALLLEGGGRVPMAKLHPGGLYGAQIAREPGRYLFEISLYRGGSEIIEDPYRFGLLLSDFDVYLHAEGTCYEAWRTMGAHLMEIDGVHGCRFSVWAPNAEAVCVSGSFNQWDSYRHPMRRREGGIWEIFLPGVRQGDIYKYFVRSKIFGVSEMKCDPYAFAAETPPLTASMIWQLGQYQWNDGAWMDARARTNWLERPFNCYEIHLESWMKTPEGEPLSYRELASHLVPYVQRLGYTHIELMPVMEHPYAGSWGYQVTGYYAPTARFGTPDDFKFFIDQCHQHGIGVIVDWVPGHFPKDAHGLARFDGTACYEYEDPRVGEHKEWGTLIFNYARNEVRNFLISNALFWLKEYHIDGLRVDAVASMLYLDYCRKEGEWVPNKYGGNENLEAISFLRKFNEEAHKVPGAVTIAEESTSFAGVSHPVYAGGLGFTMKWNMGWMHDMFGYFRADPLFRKFRHSQITFSLLYAFTENFLLPISHDEVVHGKASLIAKMPGDEWQRFANVRAFLGYMYGHPGKKLLFMGCELGQYEEWNWRGQLRWDLLQYDFHRKLQDFVRELNHFYASDPTLYEVDFHWNGFDWIDIHDIDSSVISFVRWSKHRRDFTVWVCNFTPVVRHNYRIGVPGPGVYREVLNTDWERFGGSGVRNDGDLWTDRVEMHGRRQSLSLTLPPLAVVVCRRAGG